MLELADKLEKTRNAYLSAIARGPTGEVERRALTELLWDNKFTFIEALRQAAASQGPEAPLLGLATTRELLDELRARFEMHAAGGLEYRTVDGEAIAATPADREALAAVEAGDWEWLLLRLDKSGRGCFWRDVILKLREALALPAVAGEGREEKRMMSI